MSRLSTALLCVGLAVSALSAKHHRQATGRTQPTFDYYVLSLAWAPRYCHLHPSDQSGECRPGAHKTIVLHGLWPQATDGPPPLACVPASPVASSVVDSVLQYFPSRVLIQHEWQVHGTCSGLSEQDYFRQADQAFKKIRVPEKLRKANRELDLSVSELERSFAEVNQAPEQAVRVSCHYGELINLEICLTKDLQFRACSASVEDCPASSVSLLPPQ